MHGEDYIKRMIFRIFENYYKRNEPWGQVGQINYMTSGVILSVVLRKEIMKKDMFEPKSTDELIHFTLKFDIWDEFKNDEDWANLSVVRNKNVDEISMMDRLSIALKFHEWYGKWRDEYSIGEWLKTKIQRTLIDDPRFSNYRDSLEWEDISRTELDWNFLSIEKIDIYFKVYFEFLVKLII